VGRTLEISFTPPQRATDGERLTKPLEIELLRNATPGTQPAGGPALTPWVTLPPEQWPQYLQGEKILFPASFSSQEFSPWQGGTLILAVRTLTRGFRHRPLASELSNLVQTTLLDVSGPVENLEPRATEKAVELRWTPPGRSLSGRPLSNLTGYRVYRSPTGKPGSFQWLAEVSSPPYLDGGFEFDHTYFYNVRAVFQDKGRMGESEDSQAVGITPRDVFPPAAPTRVTAVYAAGAVELVWTANTEQDLAGYRAYRRENQEPAKQLNPELLRTPILRDSTAEPGHTYFYQVRAMDLAGNESSPSEEVAVETR
jgi:hypothetical protein